MPGSLKRRDFIKAVSLAGTSLAVTNSVSAKTFLPPGDNVLIKNAYFTVSFNRKKGLIEVYRKK